MFNTKKKENGKFKEIAELMVRAVGYNTIPEFANKCGIPNSAKYIADITHQKINVYPEIGFLHVIANGSELRVSFEELKSACNYSDKDEVIDLRNIHVLRGWICFCDYGYGLDNEQSGTRPSLVIQNNIGNKHAGITMVIPLSSRVGKNKMPTHIRIGQDAGLMYESEILVEQMQVVSKRRLMSDGFIQPLTKCPEEVLREVEIAIMKQTGIVSTHLNESVVDRFLDKIDEYTEKLENNYNNNRNYGYVKPQVACAI